MVDIKNPMYGKTHTLEAREKIRQARLGKKMPEWHKKIMRKKALENPPMKNPLVAKKVSEKLKGRKFSEEHKKNLSISLKGKIAWNKGKIRTWVSGTKKGHKFGPRPEYWKKKIGDSQRGKYISIETRIKNSLAQKKRFLEGKSSSFIGGIKDKNLQWQGGKSFEPYTCEFNNKFKESIKLRDGFMCIKCGMKEEDSRILFKKGLHIHHINYDKKLTIPQNCCTTCLRCNVEANINRESWTKFYQSILSDRYGYKYEDNLPLIKLGETQ